MTIREPAIFRASPTAAEGTCTWDVYGVTESIYAGGDTLREARQDAREAFACHFDTAASGIELVEYHEHVVYTDPATRTDVWVRTYEGGDFDAVARRRSIRDSIGEHLHGNTADFDTFASGGASTGDIIATAALPDDPLATVLDQVGATDRLYVAMAKDGALYWQCLVTADAEGFDTASRPVASLGLDDDATVGEFMAATGASGTTPQDFLLQAA